MFATNENVQKSRMEALRANNQELDIGILVGSNRMVFVAPI